jgi:phosphopantetheinyl transferase
MSVVEPAMDAHLATMSAFLATQEQVMEAFLLAPEPAVHPVLGTVIRSVASVELVTRRAIDPAQDAYLDDHRLGGGLAVMPLAMSLVMLAEAGAALVPHLAVTGLRDVRAHRWLTFGDEPQIVQVTAAVVSRDAWAAEVAVELRGVTEDDRTAPVAEATVVLAAELPPPPAPLPPLTDPRPSRWTPEQLYRDVMFHGPRWQAVRSVDATGPTGARATLERLAPDDLWNGGPVPPLVLDPVTLDAAGQLIGFWTSERLDRRRVVFPFRLAALDLYCPTPDVGAQLDCSARIEVRGEHLVRSDIDVRAPDGRPWMRLRGWEDKRFDVPPQFEPLLAGHTRDAMSSEWAAALSGLADGPPRQCRELVAEIPADGGPWLDAWAHRVLVRPEREQLGALRAPPARRLEWLGARTAAKEAVQHLLRAEHGVELAPTDIEITPDPRGRPIVSSPALASLGPPPVISLAHAAGHTVALAALGGHVGIDVEQLGPRPPGFTEVAFGSAERDVLSRTPAEEREEWTLRCWCAKEAVAKALGAGLVRSPQEAAVVTIDTDREQVGLRLSGQLAALYPDLADDPLLAQTHRRADLVVATTVCTKGGH